MCSSPAVIPAGAREFLCVAPVRGHPASGGDSMFLILSCLVQCSWYLLQSGLRDGIFFFPAVQTTCLFNLPQKRVEIRMSFRKEPKAISCVILV